MKYLDRNSESVLREILASSRAAAILGARQVGKSTLAKRLIESGAMQSYYTLDEDAFRTAALTDPDELVAALSRPAIIDEVQRAPELMLAIKRVLDENPEELGQFLLTGSSNLTTSKKVADALPGRVQYLRMWPFSQGELAGVRETFVEGLFEGVVPHVVDADTGRRSYASAVARGGFPEAVRMSEARARTRFFESYLDGVLGRDLPDVFEARTETASFARLIRLLAARSGGETNFQNLGEQLGLKHATVKSHIAVLAELFLVYTLPPWSRNLGNRQIRSPKVYLSDSGMGAALNGFDEDRFAAFDQGEGAGALLETFVVTELAKQATWASRRLELGFYRDKAQREVDVVIEDSSGNIAAIEIKSTTTVRPKDLRGLNFLREKLGDRFKAGVLLYTGSATLPFGDRISAAPIRALWTPTSSNPTA